MPAPVQQQIHEVEKIVFDHPQSTYILKLKGKDMYVLVYSDTLQAYRDVKKRKHSDIYAEINKSFNMWPDIRTKRTFSLAKVEEKITCKNCARSTTDILEI